MMRSALLRLARSNRARTLAETHPAALRRRFGAGATSIEAVAMADQIQAQGRRVSVRPLPTPTRELAHARASRDAYLELLDLLADHGLNAGPDLTLNLNTIGQALGPDGPKLALEHAWDICRAAKESGATITLDRAEYRSIDSTLGILTQLRQDFPQLGAVLQSGLRRTEGDCRELGDAGARIRLVRGPFREAAAIACQNRAEVDRSYVRCLRQLMPGTGQLSIATHDRRLLAIGTALARQARREPDSYEFCFRYGVRTAQAQALLTAGENVRISLPYGSQWFEQQMLELAENPTGLGLVLRSALERRTTA